MGLFQTLWHFECFIASYPTSNAINLINKLIIPGPVFLNKVIKTCPALILAVNLTVNLIGNYQFSKVWEV